MRRFVNQTRSIFVAALLTLTALAITASAVLADGNGIPVPK
ncbi:MAG TPA: hypothetical protein VNH13_03820 [Candidatus Acidoferrales bacterium]|nr:hypothetical protein [Candidatus Acidoferrales bacterium]